jgi:hypothetical protein
MKNVTEADIQALKEYAEKSAQLDVRLYETLADIARHHGFDGGSESMAVMG